MKFDPQQFIMTTEELAREFGVTASNLARNFQRNKEEFTEGVHYYYLEGEELKQFLAVKFAGIPEIPATFARDSESRANVARDSESRANVAILPERNANNDPVNKIRNLYLWTIKGAFQHAWILKSSQAKQAYERIADQAMQRQQDPKLLEENAQLRQLVQTQQEEVQKALQVGRVTGLAIDLVDRVDLAILRIYQLLKDIEVAYAGHRDQRVIDLLRELFREQETLTEYAHEASTTNVDINFKVGAYKTSVEKLVKQIQTLTELPKQTQLPPAQRQQIKGPKS